MKIKMLKKYLEKNKKLRVVLTIDCERFISFSQTNPRWTFFEKVKGKINSLVKEFRYNEKGFEVLINTLLNERFPATLMFVQKIFAEKPKLPSFIEVGYHTKNHLPLTLISDEKLNEEVKNVWQVKSFTSPMWMIEDRKSPKRIFKKLKEGGYTHTVYRGENEGVKHWHHNISTKPKDKFGIKVVHVSAFFEGNSKKEQIREIKNQVLEKVRSTRGEDVFLITTHDFTHKNNYNLLNIIKFLKKLEEEGEIKLTTLSEI